MARAVRASRVHAPPRHPLQYPRPTPRRDALATRCRREDVVPSYVPLDLDMPHPLSAHLPMAIGTAVARCGETDVTVVMPTSESDVVDVYSAMGRPDEDPHWADVWHGDVALATAMLEGGGGGGGGGGGDAGSTIDVRGRSVINLGAGLGLAGVAAALAGASRVLMTDREPRALWCSLAAARANGLIGAAETLPASCGAPDGVALGPTPKALEPASPAASRCVVDAEIVDWFEPELAPTGFDVVLASDVLYTADAVDAIATLVLRLFSSRGGRAGRFVLADPPGRFPENHARFVRCMEDPGSIPGYAGEALITGASIERVDERIVECVNLVGETMAVKLSTYDITVPSRRARDGSASILSSRA